jgi:hypothetical protein
MASFQAELTPGAPEHEATSFALREVTACWNQAYEALGRGDLLAIAELLDLAAEQLPTATTRCEPEPPALLDLRNDALAARGRLEHGMRAGLDGLSAELAQLRRGARTLVGYRQAGGTSQPTLDDRA